MARRKKSVTESYNAPFAVALRTLMDKNGTTQEDIAKVSDKTRQTVSQYVNGVSEPGYSTLVKIADYFNVSIDYLLGRTKDSRMHRNVYDEIGLSEESTTALRLAYSARKDPSNINDFISFLYGADWDSEKNTDIYDPEELESHNLFFFVRINLLCKVLPDLADMIISIALDQGFSEKIVTGYAGIAYPDCKPGNLENIMSDYEFINFKSYEISETIRKWIIFNFSMND